MNHNEYSKTIFDITFSICLRQIRNSFMIIVLEDTRPII